MFNNILLKTKKNSLFTLMLFFLFAFYYLLLAEMEITSTGKLIVHLHGYKSIKGNIELNMFTNENGFPKQHRKAYYHVTLPLKITNEILIISNINYGKYGISAFQDKNKNKKLDTGFLGIPKEPYGFSNDARGQFGPPHFQETIFWVNSPLKEIKIKLE